MTTRTLCIAAMSVAALGLYACSSDTTGMTTTGNPSPVITAHAATIGSDAISSDAGLMMPAATSSGNLVSFDRGDDDPARGCLLDLLRWRCPTDVSGGLSVTRSITFFDAGGTAQTSFDSITTASMHIDFDISGSIRRDSWQSDIARHRHFIVTGMAGIETTRTWNGFGSDTLHRTKFTDGNVTREFDVTVNTTFTDVVIPVTGDRRHPLSGSATQVVTMTETSGDQVGQTFTFTATFTFDGTVRIPFLFGGRRFHLDLDADAMTEDD